MNNLDDRNVSQPLNPDSKTAMAQIGWLGQSGEIYPLYTETKINEPASYRPLYICVGEWKYDEELKKWFVEDGD